MVVPNTHDWHSLIRCLVVYFGLIILYVCKVVNAKIKLVRFQNLNITSDLKRAMNGIPIALAIHSLDYYYDPRVL